ncbi:hypothetical protein ACE1MK_13920 [Tenacibaculum maritimum]|uniref:hypothetical protein n=1 Tax=Tenacibaculum maritimum TaxID=107401 RepID=UPI0012E41737|nr:hypothetical protein [Tenacibaculum maritimum]MCD9582132.1 hypothetical protein [Tenacibaculum maritimum]MCD9636541.1 hypothetical protein [Tenacibaculum maritimum]CAA0168705.1 conserved membrane hypothetical protein [Tenacibaculum maritimum]CAA0173970.1 conserved membrane hypothetical protein [Tenacibaculum maritimum]CAA0209067.1 conserved membrane hypothetical protein [Tenacibaculum maritimum]
MGAIAKEITIGILVSLFATFSGFFLYLEYISRFGFYETISYIKEGGVLGAVLALSAIPNLFVFFIFLRKKQDYRARGALMATILIALVTFILKFI